ncbi:histone-lysine n-methyltransferase [Grosmannia clavigera kw1407]|uniref:Histone-lysine n-methyltransferase n=1 Tax=Grosmannia clavigera (strain kw1407 / UAMH 11150) TaxID=655863 RepID=F0XBN9_GROCL|nr:histone-lysine n-methyltransferase [Grosmannia clavigera kw1407]EFX04875.1 histone-lysine n-methyltransferase [Grosmannia clavigera kw1407]
MFSLLASTPIAQMLTRRDRPPASMPLKEESPADTGISDVPVFTETHESTAKSTPASTFSNASQPAKPEGDEIVMALSAAGATIASVTILSDDMPATPFSLAATSRLCSPQLSGISELDKDATTDCVATADVEPTHLPAVTTPSTDELSSSNSSNDVPQSLATPPSPRSSTPVHVAGPAEAEAIVEAEMMPEVYLEQEGPIIVEEASAERTGLVEAQDCTATVSVAETMDISTNEAPARQSHRLSVRQSSSAAASQPQPQPSSATETSLSPMQRPRRAVRTATSPAAKASPSAAAKPKTSNAKANVQSPVERRATRLSGTAVSLLPNPSSASSLGKRGRRLEAKKANIPRELRRLEDTKEFSHVDEKPVVYTVWSNGKYVPANAAGEPLIDKKATDKTATLGNKAISSLDDEDARGDSPRKRAKLGRLGPGAVGAEEDDDQQGFFKPTPRRVKKWLDKGLYAGQPVPGDPSVGLTATEKKALATLPELTKTYPRNETLPMPIFTGMRLLVHGRDFKMPFDVFNPLPPGQPKPVKYGRFSKNRFVGDAHAIWRKNPDFDDFSSKCVCKPETGCDEDCQNRIMLYECDDMNCNVGPERCHNREFQRLAERTASKNPYHVGVEVFKTPDRGHGIRASRSFKPSQIIMEYIGEIITEEESDRRMNELYKNNACYYLMSFDQSLIIDGTSGSIARFVNHSCSPNCRMIKWIVSGQPRIALFAGDRPIMTGEELTYDYNFDPYSSKNVQTCLCGSENCRGILGPRKRDKAATKAAAEKAAAEKAASALAKSKGGKGKNAKKAGTMLGKRKLDAYNNGKEEESVGSPAAKRANVMVPSKRGPGRPRTPEKKTKSAAKVTTTKAALAALAAKATRDARAAKATKVAKAKAAEPGSAVKTAKAGGTGKTKKPVKTVKAAKGVKVTKTARGFKAAKTIKTKTMVTTTKTTTKKTTASALTLAEPIDGAVTRKHKATDEAVPAASTANGGKAGPVRKPKGTNAEEDVNSAATEAANAETALRTTPMARALAKAAKDAAKAAKAVGKTKAKPSVGKRATTMAAAAASKRADKAKMPAKAVKPTTAKVDRPAGKAKTTEQTSGRPSSDEAAAETETGTEVAETAKEGGPPKLVQQKLDFPTIGSSPRRKPGRPPSAKTLKAKSMGAGIGTVRPQVGEVSGPVNVKRPVGRPRGSKKAVKPQQALRPTSPSLPSPASNKETEQGEKVGATGSEIMQEVSDVVQGTAEDVIHVASSVFNAAA